MDMKIGSVPAAKAVGYTRTQMRPARTEGPAPQSDSLEISASSRLFAQTLRAAQNAPEVRADRVAQIAERIAAGNYVVDSRAIAEKMLNSL